MKPDIAISIAHNSYTYRNEWPYTDYHAGGRVWTRDSAELEFRTKLDSGQTLAVRFDRPQNVWARHCQVSAELDNVFLGWFKDTAAIPSVATRRALEYFLTAITPTAKRVISQTRLKEKQEAQTMRARADARSRERATRERAAREEAIRKADGGH